MRSYWDTKTNTASDLVRLEDAGACQVNKKEKAIEVDFLSFDNGWWLIEESREYRYHNRQS